MNELLTEMRFWRTVLANAERTIYCSPEEAERVQDWVEANPLASGITVRMHICVPPGALYVVDENGLRADLNEAVQRAVMEPVRERIRYSDGGAFRHLYQPEIPASPPLFPFGSIV